MESYRALQQHPQTSATVTPEQLKQILITEELARRPVRPPDFAIENRALVALAECMAQTPALLLSLLVDLSVALCNAGSAGISLLKEDADGEYFSWVATSGAYTSLVGGRTPREFSPCGITLDLNAPQLFSAPARLFTYLAHEEYPLVEGLVVPFAVNLRAAGTIWVVSHDAQHQFDAEDVRIMTSLARFAGAAIQILQTVDAEVMANQALKAEIAEQQDVVATLRQGETTLLERTSSLEQQVQDRTSELQRSNRELDQFTYVASHDLKAPLRAIDQLARWVVEDTGNLLPAASQEHLAKLTSRIKRLEALLEDLLAYSRAGRYRHPVEMINTTMLVTSVVDLLDTTGAFTLHIEGHLPTVVAERIPLETVFRSLISNAIKHHPDPTTGEIHVSAQDQGEFYLFRVKDNGPGIEGQFHERIFEMFYTLRSRDQVEGSGIGLSIVKKIVESRGGSVEVESSLGNGATFSFTWPKSPPASHA